MKKLLTMILLMSPLFVFSNVDFKTNTISVGSLKLSVELATTPAQHEQGLMFRTQLKEGKGMLFVFDDERVRSFWMKNTFIPLSIGFFNAQKQLIDIQEMAPVASEMDMNIKTYTSSGPAKFALEAPKGWFARHKIKEGVLLGFKE